MIRNNAMAMIEMDTLKRLSASTHLTSRHAGSVPCDPLPQEPIATAVLDIPYQDRLRHELVSDLQEYPLFLMRSFLHSVASVQPLDALNLLWCCLMFLPSSR